MSSQPNKNLKDYLNRGTFVVRTQRSRQHEKGACAIYHMPALQSQEREPLANTKGGPRATPYRTERRHRETLPLTALF